MRLLLLLVFASGAAGAATGAKPPTRNQFYAAIAYHAESNSFGWATDRKSAREAKVEALRQCSHEKCEVVAAITRGCGALAKDAKNAKKFVVEKGATRNEAEAKALKRCGSQCEVLAWTCTR
jgi:hypothetical protein